MMSQQHTHVQHLVDVVFEPQLATAGTGGSQTSSHARHWSQLPPGPIKGLCELRGGYCTTYSGKANRTSADEAESLQHSTEMGWDGMGSPFTDVIQSSRSRWRCSRTGTYMHLFITDQPEALDMAYDMAVG